MRLACRDVPRRDVMAERQIELGLGIGPVSDCVDCCLASGLGRMETLLAIGALCMDEEDDTLLMIGAGAWPGGILSADGRTLNRLFMGRGESRLL